jgi:hypothetical protein
VCHHEPPILVRVAQATVRWLHRGRLRGEILSFTLADIQQELIKVMRDVAAEESGDVLVALGHAAVGPADELHRGALRDTEEQENRGGSEAGVVQASLPNAGVSEELYQVCFVDG